MASLSGLYECAEYAGDLNRWLLVLCWCGVQVICHLHVTCICLHYEAEIFPRPESCVIDNPAFMSPALQNLCFMDVL